MQKIIISKKLNKSENFEWQNFIKKINAENVEI